MRVQGDTVTVAGGSLSATITGSFTAPYAAGVTPSWNTTVFMDQASKTAIQFVVQFGTAPGVNGADADWGVTDSA